MPSISERISSLSHAERQLYETAAEQFEEDWSDSPRDVSDIVEYLTVEGPARTPLLVHMIKCDMDLRSQAGQARSLEDYIGRLPELANDAEAMLELLTWEYALTKNDGSSTEEFVRRFPDLEERFRTATNKFAPPNLWTPPEGYDLEPQPIGRGAWGVVYKAYHRGAQRDEALKVVDTYIRSELGSQTVRNRVNLLRQEIPAVANLNHPNIVHLYSVGESDGRPYFAMEYCPGGSLRQRLTGGPLSERDSAALLCSLGEAIGAVHAFNLVHRDLKPDNILFAMDGTPKIADFGLALPIPSNGQGPGDLAGTPGYMAPEQIDSSHGQVGPQTDIYGLGAVMYHCLTGQPPFAGKDDFSLMADSLRMEPISPRIRNPSLSRDVEAICLKCLAKKPTQRYISARSLADDLRRLLAEEPVEARPQPWMRLAWHWLRCNALKSIAAFLLMAATMVTFKIRSDAKDADLAVIRLEKQKAEKIAELESERAEAEKSAAHAERVNAARVLARRGDWFAALAEYDRIIADRQPDALRLRVEALPGCFATNNTSRLEEELRDLESGELGALAAQVKLMHGAWLLCDETHFEDGKKLVQEALENRQLLFSTADAKFGEAIIASQMRQTIDLLTEAVHEDPFHFLAGSSLAMTLASVGDEKLARVRIQFLRGVFPASPLPDFADTILAFILGNEAEIKQSLGRVALKLPENQRDGIKRTEEFLRHLSELRGIVSRAAMVEGISALAELPRALQLLAKLKIESGVPNLEPLAIPVPAFGPIVKRWLKVFDIYMDMGAKAKVGLLTSEMLPQLQKFNSDYPDAAGLVLESAIHLQSCVDPLNRGELDLVLERLQKSIDCSIRAVNAPCILQQSAIPFLAVSLASAGEMSALKLFQRENVTRSIAVCDRIHEVVKVGRNWPNLRSQFAGMLVDIAIVPLSSEPKLGWDFERPEQREEYAKRRLELGALARLLLDEWAIDDPKNKQIPKLRKHLEDGLAKSGIIEPKKEPPQKK